MTVFSVCGDSLVLSDADHPGIASGSHVVSSQLCTVASVHRWIGWGPVVTSYSLVTCLKLPSEMKCLSQAHPSGPVLREAGALP